MTTEAVECIPGIPPELCEEFDEDEAIVAAVSGASKAASRRKREQFLRGRFNASRYNARTQPRDSTGRFRRILARLKSNLGETENERIIEEIREAEKQAGVGDYAKASGAASNVVEMIDKIESGTFDESVERSLRKGAADLGKVLAYLPIPQGVDTEKVRFSDLPPSTSKLIRDMIDRVEAKLTSEEAAKQTSVLKSFISGVRTMSSDELSAELNKLLRLLV